MSKKLNIATAQLNFIVGDLEGNKQKIIAAHKKAHSKGADIIIFSEMAITGYPPEDLVLRKGFQDKSTDIVRELAPYTKNGTAMLVGCLWRECDDHIFNAAALLDNGKIEHITSKYDLPNYGVFDEKRVFRAAPLPEPLHFRGVNLGILICEDLWGFKVSKHLEKQGAEILVSINASPFEAKKHNTRMETAKKNVRQTSLPLIYVNQYGGQDELVFEGGSFILDKEAKVSFRQPRWKESLEITQWFKNSDGLWQCKSNADEVIESDRLQNIYEAIKLGLKDYVEKNGFFGVIIGMSGGIDSALSAAVAVDALGKNKVRLVMMPSKYTSDESLADAAECSKLLGVKLESIDIEKAVKAFDEMLADSFEGLSPDVTEENMQSRIRGNILMALSNKFGHMVLTTGNKSEMAVGYATLYGDMCGGYNVLKDIYKTDVFALAKWLNKHGTVIPENIITKPPTAELRPNQKDEDSLPPYKVLDDILVRLIEERHSIKQIIEHGHPENVVKKVAGLVKLAEYKRRQAPPGPKISMLAFGKDRRYPITNKYNF
ncbi:MAG: NAD+ synthase [Rickettsiales bacterium]|nr:NAD+ synthase [Pseudomonadota bacterium]MDA0967288.1 NAD+ synthase [Pseudomonadota bacterium]MDG4544051.1 NAD+ synthase [Rickettsiales bacterium]MDG4546255.1 NAD+ synthase [Rickettsiales bacterium]MDG4548375.1 NAD+ synthase [Rickettsiales bacterium]